jgi:hypothetical protein
MFTRKINYIWVINLLLFVAVVVMGIDQAGKGATISSLERKLESISVSKRELTENIFNSGSEDKLTNTEELGFAKPSKVLYFNSIETVASR